MYGNISNGNKKEEKAHNKTKQEKSQAKQKRSTLTIQQSKALKHEDLYIYI